MNNKVDPEKCIMTFAEFMADAQTSDLLAPLPALTTNEVIAMRYERDRAWSLLNGQVVGAEVFPWD